MDALRIAVVTPLCPTHAEPYRGRPITQTVLALSRRAAVEVFYVQAAFPRLPCLRPRRFLHSPADQGHSLPGIAVHHLEYPALPLVTRPFNGRTCARRLLPYLEKARPDVILAYWLYPEGYGALRAGEQLGIPVVLGARGSDLHSIPDPLSGRMTKAALRRACFVLTVSEGLRQRALELGVDPERARTVRNGCDSSVFRLGERRSARAELGVDAGAQLVLFVGRLQPVKGLADLMEAVARLLPSHPRLEAVLVGEGIMEKDLRARIMRPDLRGRVRLLGRRSPVEVARWLTAADLLCLPSHAEGCPNVLLEAFLCGRPVVAAEVGGIPELVNERCGILVPPKDIERLAAALADGLRRRWDEAAIAGVFGRRWDDVADETHGVCRLAVEQNGQPERRTGMLQSFRAVKPALARKVRNMKVLHLTLSLAPGGRRETILMLAEHLPRLGVTCELGCLEELGCSSEEAAAFPAPVTAFGRRFALDLAALGRIAAFCRERRVDVIHAHDAASQFAAALVRLYLPGTKILMNFHRSLPNESATRKDRLRNACASALCGAIVTASRERRAHFLEQNVVNRAKVVRIPPGIDLQRFHPDEEARAALRQELGFGPEITVLGVVGHFGEEKGVDVALNGFRELCRRRDPASLALMVLGGGSPERTASLHELAGRDPRMPVSFQGCRTDVERWFRAMDIFVHPPRLEGFGLVLIEAMASGLPVVATRVGGIPDIVRENRTGLLVPPESPEQLAQALDDLMSNAAQRAAMGEEGYRVVHLEYGSDLCAQRYRRLYEALLVGRPPRDALPETAA